MNFKLFSLAAICVAVIALPALAHHSHGNYDVSTWTSLEGTVKEVHLLVPHSWIYLTVKDDKGQTALIKATSKAHANAAETLIRAGANVNIQDDHDGMCALAYAAQFGPASVCELLLQKGAQVNVKNYNGQTPLLCAASNLFVSSRAA